MPGDLTDSGTSFSPAVGLVFIFNLIVGTGALAMPSAFDQAGWLISLILVSGLAFMSYLTVTFMLESMAAANALRRWSKIEQLRSSDNHGTYLPVAQSPYDDFSRRRSFPEYSGSIQTESIPDVDEHSPLLGNHYDPLEWCPLPSLQWLAQAWQGTPRYTEHSLPEDVLQLERTKELNSPYGVVDSVPEAQLDDSDSLGLDPERRPLLKTNSGSLESSVPHYFEIVERIEMGQMASMFFNRAGVNLFYVCMAVYLYGDLAIYGAAVPKSLRDVACTYEPPAINGSHCNESLKDSDPCWETVPSINRMDAYRIFLAIFTVTLGSFVFFNVQKTKYLQLFTTFMRWLAFSMMIALALIRIADGNGEGNPPVADFAGIPTLFGVCVYSFMCHHSLPSLVTPIENKSRLIPLFAADYSLILAFYCLLSFTGIFSFKDLQDLYTLNFQPSSCGGNPITNIVFIQYFLALFPVFTLSTNFPIIGITLRNNLKTMILHEDREYPFFIDRICFPLLTLVPPVIVAMITNKIDLLVGFTGSYAGTGIQYVIPAAMVLLARRDTAAIIGTDITNKHRSPFKHKGWIILVFCWAALCITFVTANHIITGK